jgi:hypothetical protein
MGKSRALKMRHLAAIFAFALTTTAAAQPYPARVITIVVPLPPGGATDTLARTLADHMRRTLGQPIIGFRAFHQAEIEKWWPIIKAANIKNE